MKYRKNIKLHPQPMSLRERRFKELLEAAGCVVEDFTPIGYGVPDFFVISPSKKYAYVEIKGRHRRITKCQRRTFNSGIYGKVRIFNKKLSEHIKELLEELNS